MKSWSWRQTSALRWYQTHHNSFVGRTTRLYKLVGREQKPSVALSWGARSQVCQTREEACVIVSSGYSDALLHKQRRTNLQARNSDQTTNAKSVLIRALIRRSRLVVTYLHAFHVPAASRNARSVSGHARQSRHARHE